VNSIHLQKAKVLFIIGLALLLTCQRPAGPPPGPYAGAELRLEQLSVTCTEVWLKVSLSGVDSAGQGLLRVQLQRDDSTVSDFYFLPPDTIIRDYGLQPGRSYRYRLIRGSGTGSSSPELTITTLDTTSHDFVWEIDTLGDYGSYLKDVWIVDEDDIWVVGYLEKTVYDSAGNSHTSWYDAVHWDGERWEYILFGPAGVIGNGIYAFSDTNIWVATGIIYHWDGHEWQRYHLWDMGILAPEDGGVNKVWGSSPDDVYFVGTGGSIVHWDGAGFEKLESGTEYGLGCVTGTPDGGDVFVCGGSLHPGNLGSILLHIHEGQVETIFETTSIDGGPNDWGYIREMTIIGDTLYLIGAGRDWVAYNYKTGGYEEHMKYTLSAFKGVGPVHIASQGYNDIVVVGDLGELLHFNGLGWYRNDSFKSIFQYQQLVESIAINGNMAVMVGAVFPQGINRGMVVFWRR